MSAAISTTRNTPLADAGFEDAEVPNPGAAHPVCVGWDLSAPEVVALPQLVPLADDAPRLIGLCGAAGSGKSTVAGFLEGLGYTRLRFADPLKAMLRAVLVSQGALPEVAEQMVDGDLKETTTDLLAGKSPRHAMQTLGTEWGRDQVSPDFWRVAAMRRAQAVLDAGGRVVMDDVRFPNEARAIKGTSVDQLMGIRVLWKVCGRGGISGSHVSEAYQDALDPDLHLDNYGCLEALEAAVMSEVLG